MSYQVKHGESSLLPIAREVFEGMMQASVDPEIQCAQMLGCRITNVSKWISKLDDSLSLRMACERFLDATTERGERGEVRAMRYDGQLPCWSQETKDNVIDLLVHAMAARDKFETKFNDVRDEGWQSKYHLLQRDMLMQKSNAEHRLSDARREHASALNEQYEAHRAAIKTLKAEMAIERKKSAALEAERKTDRQTYEAKILALERQVNTVEIAHAATVTHMHAHIEHGITRRPDHQLHLQAWECERDARKYEELARAAAKDYVLVARSEAVLIDENKMLRARLAEMERLHEADADQLEAKAEEILDIKHDAAVQMLQICERHDATLSASEQKLEGLNAVLEERAVSLQRHCANDFRTMLYEKNEAKAVAADTRRKLLIAENKVKKLTEQLETATIPQIDDTIDQSDASFFSSSSEISFHPSEAVVDLEAAARFLSPITRSPRTPMREAPRFLTPSASPNVLTPSRKGLNAGNVGSARRANAQTSSKITLVKVL